MPRKHRNARHIKRTRKLRKPRAVLLRIHKRYDDISVGRLVAVAEWREVRI